MKYLASQFYNDTNGAALLISVVAISVVVLVITLSVSLLGIGELDLGYTESKSEEALQVADGCAEETLRRLRLDENWATGGTETFSVGGNLCSIDVVVSAVDERTITSTATVDEYTFVVEAVADVSGTDVQLTSWQTSP